MTREEAIKVLDDMKVKIRIPKSAEIQLKKNEALDMAIEALSGSEKLNRWIPVSEKLPSDGKYLVTRGDVIGRPMIGMRYFSKDLSKVDEFDFVDKKGISGWCEYDSEYGWYIDDKVIAWCELPEPYKAEGSDS